MSKTITATQRKRVAERAHFCCEYCLSQLDYSPDPFSIEHILPQILGGTNHIDNLAFSCQECNNYKYTYVTATDLISGEVVPLYHPRQHDWYEHFAWNEDFTRIIGLTASGRATIEKLQLNREGVMNLRHALSSIGKHPPSLA